MLPENISTFGHLVDNLILIIFVITLMVTVLAFGIIIYAVIRYNRNSNPHTTYKFGPFISKIIYLDAAMIVFDLIIAYASVSGWAHVIMRSRSDLISEHKEYVDVRIIGRQFFWSFNYAGLDNKMDTNDDFIIANKLVVPIDTLVLLNLTSGDVIHSFFAPHLRLKYDAIPGRSMDVWFKATKTGSYEIACAELCGAEHYRMKAKLEIVTKEQYKSWLNERSGALSVR
ncbi:MAG: cytochrome c oxidase subunit II [Planctomycetes bacterium]|nr:cytochrome c oxidase subunit II [Planctomycetota bacterium]